MATPCSKNARSGVNACRIFSENLSQFVDIMNFVCGSYEKSVIYWK